LEWAEEEGAAPPGYLSRSSKGLKKYEKSFEWMSDPELIFANQFFKFAYPCGSFVVIHPSRYYRAYLGEALLS